MNKKFKLLLTMALSANLIAPSILSIQAQTITMEETSIYLTERNAIDFEVDFGSEFKVQDLSFTLGDKPLSEWKGFDMEAGEYNLDPWIRVEDLSIEGSILKGKLVNAYPYGIDATDLRPFPRWTFEELLGTYPLKVKDEASGTEVSIDVTIKNYEGFHQYDAIQPELDQIIATGNEKGDRFFKYESIGTTDEGREIPSVIIAKDEATIDNYLNGTLQEALTDPAALSEKIGQENAEPYQIPIYINNIHPDESPGVDAQIDLLKDLASKDELIFNGTEAGKFDSINVNEVLDNYILIFCVTQNPDGKAANTRENSHKIDVNRDNIYQTQAESKAMAQNVSKWKPLIFVDLHGFVPEFLLEPCTPPHEPNFEYDLLMGGEMDPETKDVKDNLPGAINHARAMGQTGIANTDFTSYIIPMFDYGDGWDDGFLGYTAVYSLMHGALGHTVEIPAQNQQSMLAAKYAVIGSINYAMDNKTELYKNQLEGFRRGLENEDSRSVDTWMVQADGSVTSRPRGENENFFPDYYILPMDKEHQKNVNEVYSMVEFFIRNGVKVFTSNEEVTYKDVAYPAGSLIIPMKQVNRGIANAALYGGTDESAWGAMYAELVLNYPKMYGFDSIEVREPGLFDEKLTEVTEAIAKPATEVAVTTDKAVIANNNNDVLMLVNALLAEGKTVEMVTKGNETVKPGDYIVPTADLDGKLEGLRVDLSDFADGIETKAVEQPKIYLTPSSSNYAELADSTRFVLQQLGFTLVETIEEANVVVDSSGMFEKDELKGKHYIGIGSSALAAVQEKELYPLELQMNEEGWNNEGLLKANYDPQSVIAGSYLADDIAYVNSGSVLKAPREEAKVFAKVADADDFYLAGWWPDHEFVKGQVLGFADKMEDTNFVFFASDITNKAHTRHLYRLLANALFAINSEAFMTGESLKVTVPAMEKPESSEESDTEAPSSEEETSETEASEEASSEETSSESK